MKKEIVLDIEKVYQLFSDTYFAMKEIQKADLDDKRVFGITGIKNTFCGNWNAIIALGLEEEYYNWRKMNGFWEE